MQTLSEGAMQLIDGGGDWADFACGVAAAVTIGGIIMLSEATFGLAAALVFAGGYSVTPAACAIAAAT